MSQQIETLYQGLVTLTFGDWPTRRVCDSLVADRGVPPCRLPFATTLTLAV